MSARLTYDANTAMGKQLAESTNALLRETADFPRLQASMSKSIAGEPPDFAFLAGEIGCPVDQAQGIFTVVDGVKLALDVPALRDLSIVDQG